MSTTRDIAFLRQAIEESRESRENGNHPFGAILVNGNDEVVLRAQNTFETDRGPGHAETNFAIAPFTRPSSLAACAQAMPIGPE